MPRRIAPLAALLVAVGCASHPGHDYRGVATLAPLSDTFRSWRPDGPRTVISRRAAAPDPSAECVPFARDLSGIAIVGDAWTWWGQAAGRYARGRAPELGSVMVFQPTEDMPLGHVAVVTAVLGSREVLVSHRNWAGGLEKGRIDLDRPVQDVSSRNDWSSVRVWHEATGRLGPGAHRLAGFVHAREVPPRDGRGRFEVAEVR
ncbi:CHAP domain-containing protein [Elioraea rosea]|uniref:CHAP domain-containing protein n=1 Tax=Elioraea rosea TaxID=2492390 RepID=UPI0011866F68|nr:CHAP domain-containing protein [Elioraea rosea]